MYGGCRSKHAYTSGTSAAPGVTPPCNNGDSRFLQRQPADPPIIRTHSSLRPDRRQREPADLCVVFASLPKSCCVLRADALNPIRPSRSLSSLFLPPARLPLSNHNNNNNSICGQNPPSCTHPPGRVSCSCPCSCSFFADTRLGLLSLRLTFFPWFLPAPRPGFTLRRQSTIVTKYPKQPNSTQLNCINHSPFSLSLSLCNPTGQDSFAPPARLFDLRRSNIPLFNVPIIVSWPSFLPVPRRIHLHIHSSHPILLSYAIPIQSGPASLPLSPNLFHSPSATRSPSLRPHLVFLPHGGLRSLTDLVFAAGVSRTRSCRATNRAITTMATAISSMGTPTRTIRTSRASTTTTMAAMTSMSKASMPKASTPTVVMGTTTRREFPLAACVT